MDKRKLSKSEVLSTCIIVAEFRNVHGGRVGVLVGHMDCKPGVRKKQWDVVHRHLSASPKLPLLSFIDHNSVIVPGVDSADIPRELPQTVKAGERGSLVLAELDVEDVWVHQHGEHRHNALSGFTYPSLSRQIDQIHLFVDCSRLCVRYIPRPRPQIIWQWFCRRVHQRWLALPLGTAFQ